MTAEYTYTIPDRPEPGILYAVIEDPEIVEYEYDSASLTAVVSNCDFTKYTYQWYDENDRAIADSNGNVTEKDHQITLPLPTGKEVGMEKYYLTVTGAAIAAGDPVSGSSNDGIFVVEAKKITAITLKDVANPKVGEAPDTDAAIADTENYAQEGEIVWYDGETRVKEFDYNKIYTAKITLLPKNQNYAFATGEGAVAAKVNDKNAEAEVTVMFSRLITEKMDSNKDYSSSFPDVSEDSWYAPQLGFMEQYGIIEGYEDGSFRPYNAITRAEVISIVNRMLERSCDKEYLENNPDEIKTYNDVTDEHWAYYDITEASNAHLYQKTPDEVWTEIAQ